MQALRVERDLESLPEALGWEMYYQLYWHIFPEPCPNRAQSLEYLEEAGLHILGAWVATEHVRVRLMKT